MKFLDEVSIKVKSGHGGPGSRHFRREKYVPLGGPDGGNGGRGGSVIIKSDPNKQTLIDFKYKPHWHAENGVGGGSNGREGRRGADLIILVPVGTQVSKDGELICDLDVVDKSFVLCKGGIGGKGNEFFKTPTNRGPDYAQPGMPGEEGDFTLTLKLVADVGIIGFPNAGKSTFISRVSHAKPKIADYPFTTLVPNLGVAKVNDRAIVMADIPGLIPGASEGKGLGIQFLKHIERTKVLLHLIDVNSDAIESYHQLNHELKNFSEFLTQKSQVVALTKIETIPESDLKEMTSEFEKIGVKTYNISSVTGAGIEQLLQNLVKFQN